MSTRLRAKPCTRRRKSFARWASIAALFTTVGVVDLAHISSAAQVAHAHPAAVPALELSACRRSPTRAWTNGSQRFTGSLKGEITAALSRGRSLYGHDLAEVGCATHAATSCVYLAMIESEFKPQARSHASAVGLWQFMASTARRFGLNGGARRGRSHQPVQGDRCGVDVSRATSRSVPLVVSRRGGVQRSCRGRCRGHFDASLDRPRAPTPTSIEFPQRYPPKPETTCRNGSRRRASHSSSRTADHSRSTTAGQVRGRAPP